MDRRGLLSLAVITLLAVAMSAFLYGYAPVVDSPVRATERLISLSPQMTETLWVLGAQDRLVGRSDYCKTPQEALALPGVGTSLTPNLEAIARLQPDRIVLEATASPHDALASLAPVEAIPWLGLDEVLAGVLRLGTLTDRSPKAAELAHRLEQRLRVDPPEQGPRVLVALGADLSGGEVWFIQPNSLHGDAMHAAGVLNAVGEDVQGPPSMPVEQLVRLDPDLIIVISADPDLNEQGKQALIDAFRALPTLTAVKDGRIGVLAGFRYLSPGPAILEFVDALEATVVGLMEPQ